MNQSPNFLLFEVGEDKSGKYHFHLVVTGESK